MGARRHRRVVFGVLAVVLAALALRAWSDYRARDRDAWETVVGTGVVRVGMDASYTPFEWVDAEGRFRGYDVGLAQAMAERWGVRVELVNIAFDGLYEAMMARRVDILVSALPYDQWMTRDVRYSSPYLLGGQVMLVPAGAVGVTGPEGLRGLDVAVEMGSEAHALLSRLNRMGGKAVAVVPAPDMATAAASVAAGEAAAMVCDRIDALALSAGGALTISGEPITVDPYVVATRRDSPRMAAQVQAALDAFAVDGTLTDLERAWLVPSPVVP